MRHVSKTYDDGVIRPIVSPGFKAFGLTGGRAAAGAGGGGAFGAAAAERAPAAAAPANRRTSRRVLIRPSEHEADGHRHEREMASEDEVGIRLDLHVAGLDEDRADRSGSEGDSDARVPPEFVLCVLELAELPRREELDPVEAGAADQVRPEDH